MKPNPKSAWLHDLNNVTREEFKFLTYALNKAWEKKVTGYIVTPFDEVINLKKGRRKSVDGKKWIPCNR